MRIKLIINRKKQWAVSFGKKVSSFLKKNKFIVTNKNADVTVCIGGDGTILYSYHKGWIHGPVLGIGSKSSHICQLKKENWSKHILRILKKNKKQKRLTLSARAGKTFESVNDVVVHTHDYRVIELSVVIDRKKHSFEGDGVIVSTPTGSPAYAYSAGGPLISSRDMNIEVVPICPYKRKFSPVVLNKNSVIKVSADRTSDLVIDGIYIKRLKPKEKVSIKKGNGIDFLSR